MSAVGTTPLYTEAIIPARTGRGSRVHARYTFSLLDVGDSCKDSPFEQAATYLNNALIDTSLIGVV